MIEKMKGVLHEFEDVRLLLGIGGGVAAFLVTVTGFLNDQMNLSDETILNFTYFVSFLFIMGFMYFGVTRRGVKAGRLDAEFVKDGAGVDAVLVQERQRMLERANFYNQMVKSRDAELLQVRAELAQVRIELTGMSLENDSLKNIIFQVYKETNADEIHKILKPILDSFGRGGFTGFGDD